MILGRTAKGDLRLPSDAVTQPFGILGRRGSGKTYVGGVLAEGMLADRQQVVIFDPVGTFWSLRLSADGKGPGFAIPVFGGAHGDVPIEPGAGALLADLIVDKALSAVLDVSELRKGPRKDFVTAFAEQLFHRKKKDRSPMHLMIEEAQVFAPQQCGPDEKRMLGAMEDLVRLGRNYGIGVSMLSQRPQSVNKEVLSQVECLIVLQTSGAHERKAIEAWVVEHGIDVAAMVRELPALAQGEAFVWSPQWLRRLDRVRIAKKRTFDASATPTRREREIEPRQLEAGELEQLRGAMADVVKRAEENDPTKLRKRIAQLERDLAAGAKATPAADGEALARAFAAGRAEGAGDANGRLTRLAAQVQARDGRAARALDAALIALQKAGDAVREPIDVDFQASTRTVALAPVRLGKTEEMLLKRTPGQFVVERRPRAEGVTGPMQRILDAISWLESIGVGEPEQTAVAFLAGYTIGGGAWNNPRGALRTAGLIEYLPVDRVRLTDAGRRAAVEPSAPLTTTELHDRVLGRLPGPEQKILAVLLAAYPDAVANDELARRAGYEPGGGAYNNPRGRLRSLGLVEYPERGQVRARPLLFLEDR